ncbi:MAG: C39 family peptidase [Mycobacterium sp.]
MAAVVVDDELVLEEIDSDDNGAVDFAVADLDGNGIEDAYFVDYNEDGGWDARILDANEDGIDDSFEVDENYNGTLDRIEYFDTTGGLIGSEADTDGDGVVDQIATDSDGDGILDRFEYDTDGDGEIDDVNEVADPLAGGGGVYGESEAQYWQYQEVNGLCGPTSAAIILSEQLGAEVPFTDVAQTAVDLGIIAEYDNGEFSGTFAHGMVDVFAEYGVEATVEYGDLPTLEGFLEEGRDVMVAVDAFEIWGGDDSVTSNHYLVVTEIDEQNGIVTLNDPGTPDGAAMEVPLETFVDAWADGSNEMIVTATAGEGDDGFVDLGDDQDSGDQGDDDLSIDDLTDFDPEMEDGDVPGALDLDEIFGLRGAVVLAMLLRP